jgi:AcrR family transcriptional regulator
MPAITRAEQAEQTRQAIVVTAIRLFNEHGYDATSLQAIADALGITKANVYYYFHTKAEILEASLAPSLDRIGGLLDEAEAIRGKRERVRFLIDGYVGVLVTNRGMAMAAVGNAEPAMRREKHINASIDGLLSRGLTVMFGARPTPDERIAYLLITTLSDFVTEFADLSDDELRTTLTRTCEHLLRLRPSR